MAMRYDLTILADSPAVWAAHETEVWFRLEEAHLSPKDPRVLHLHQTELPEGSHRAFIERVGLRVRLAEADARRGQAALELSENLAKVLQISLRAVHPTDDAAYHEKQQKGAFPAGNTEGQDEGQKDRIPPSEAYRGPGGRTIRDIDRAGREQRRREAEDRRRAGGSEIVGRPKGLRPPKPGERGAGGDAPDPPAEPDAGPAGLREPDGEPRDMH